MINRNDPCWCGSGKKYKKCHLRDDVEKGAVPQKQHQKKLVKTPIEIEGMRKAGEFNGRIIDYIRDFIREGVSTEEINRRVHDFTVQHGHVPATLGYHHFPKSVCTSVNNVVCHGIPSEHEILTNGDIVNVDVTTIVDGYHGDSSETFSLGDISPKARHLVSVTAHALLRAIHAVGPEKHLSIIAESIEPYVRENKCSVVRQYTGHGIGRSFHEFFTVYHHIDKDCDDIILKPGMTLTIEPMVNLGGYKVITDKFDKWTVRTRDGSLSAQFEHTVLVTDTGCEVLTLTPFQRSQKVLLHTPGIELDKDLSCIPRA